MKARSYRGRAGEVTALIESLGQVAVPDLAFLLAQPIKDVTWQVRRFTHPQGAAVQRAVIVGWKRFDLGVPELVGGKPGWYPVIKLGTGEHKPKPPALSGVDKCRLYRERRRALLRASSVFNWAANPRTLMRNVREAVSASCE